jgi:hypothetical protein
LEETSNDTFLFQKIVVKNKEECKRQNVTDLENPEESREI